MSKLGRTDMLTRIRNVLIVTAVILSISALFLFVSARFIHVPCFFHEITGLSCPACGNTRAVISLLSFDVYSAFSYNRLFLPELMYIAWVYINSSFSYIKGARFSYRTPSIIIDISLLVIFLAWGIIRNILCI